MRGNWYVTGYPGINADAQALPLGGTCCFLTVAAGLLACGACCQSGPQLRPRICSLGWGAGSVFGLEVNQKR